MDDLLIHIKKIHWSKDVLLSKFEMTKIKHLKFLQGLESREGCGCFALGIYMQLKYSDVRALIKYQVSFEQWHLTTTKKDRNLNFARTWKTCIMEGNVQPIAVLRLRFTPVDC
jgi:hypothetical protein